MSRLTRLRPLLIAAFLVLPSSMAAQETRTVTGSVTAVETGQPMSGVLVSVSGQTGGALTDAQGNFTLEVSETASALTFSHVGYRTEEVALADATQPLSVSLEIQAIGLEGIVVTALGVQREKRSLGYSVQDVSGDRLAEVPELNIVNSLQGNVAGVKITNAGPTGGSSRIVIRGVNSIAGNNQPLFIVDGVPIDNSSPRIDGYGGIDYGNTAQDIGAENIESISVLKGPNAAALYGSRAANGAIVITTKRGELAPEGSIGLSATVSLTAETPLKLPNFQNVYGQGVNGQYNFVDGDGAGTNDGVDESWGPRMLCSPDQLIDQFTGDQQMFCPQPDNVRNFFDTGRTLNTQVAVSRAGEDSNVRLSISNSNVQGIFPGTELNTVNVGLRGGANLSDRLSAEASINYINRKGENRTGTGYDADNPMQQFIWFGRQVDIDELRNYQCAGNERTECFEGGQYNWNYNYHNNPFWEQLVNGNEDQRDRVIANVSANYQFNDWLGAQARVGRDWYRDHRKDWKYHYSLDDDGLGSFTDDNFFRSETNAELMLNATHQLTPDLRLDAMAGGNLRQNNYEENTVTVDRLNFPGIYTLENAAVTPFPEDFTSDHQVRSLLGSMSLNYRGYLNLDVTGRNDWSSTLPEDNNSYFYPSVSTAFVFTDAFDIASGTFSSGKLRASWTRVGSDTDPYRLRSVFGSSQPWDGIPMFSGSDTLANPNLKPEETTAWEIGTDLGFFDERLGFVLTYYDSRTKNQILGVEISRASGFTNQILNAGEIRNYGTELLVMANPVRTPKFSWDVTLNWSKNNSQVRELYGDLETLALGDYWGLNVEMRAPRRDENGNVVEYYPTGTLFGNGYLRCTQESASSSNPPAGCTNETVGEFLLTEDGFPQMDGDRRVLGSYAPDWQGGIQNRFRFGPAELSVLIDGQKGGNVFSVTDYFGEYAGVLESSLRGRENDICDPGIVVNGILPDGSMNGESGEEVTVCPQDYFGDPRFGIHESAMKDASYIKLREVRLGYDLPPEFVGRLGFSAASIALIGRNLALWSKTDNIDPETAFDASNVQGIEFGQHPTERSIGFSVSVRP